MFYEFQHFGNSEYLKKEYGENFVFPVHLHRAFEFITATSGKMNVTVDEKEYELTPGKALLIFPDQLHSISGGICSHMLCIFSPELVKAYFSNIKDKLPTSNLFIPDRRLTDAVDQLNSDDSLMTKKGILYCLCAEFDKAAAYIARESTGIGLVHEIFRFVEQNHSGDCSLKRLSAETGFSYSYLSRSFKKTTGISFNSYVNRYRISNACYLLKNTDCSVLKCALDCGYDSLRSFNRNFKELVSLAPNEYREKTDNNFATLIDFETKKSYTVKK